MSWSLARKISAALIAILVSTMMVTALFSFFKFEDVMSSLVRSRYSFVAFTIKQKVEDSLNLGFALRQLRQMQETVELEKARDEQIQGIEIYDGRGEVLFNSDRGGIGSSVPESWMEPLTLASPQPFALKDEDSNVVGLPLVNNLGKVEGAIVLLYPTGYVGRELGPELWWLAAKVSILGVVFAILALVVASVALGQVRRRLRAMEAAALQSLRDDAQQPAAGAPALAEFSGRFGEFVAKSHEVVEHIKVSTDEVERLDRLA